MKRALIGFTALVLLAMPAQAQDKSLGVQGKGFYAFATSDSQANGAVFGLLKNVKPVEVTITNVTGDIAESYELHTMSMEGDVMEMRQVEGISVPLRDTHLLHPAGDHIMLMGLKRPLKEGDTIYLRIEDAEGRGVQLPVAVRAAGDVSEEMAKQAEIHEQKKIGRAARLAREEARKKKEEQRAAAAEAAAKAAEEAANAEEAGDATAATEDATEAPASAEEATPDQEATEEVVEPATEESAPAPEAAPAEEEAEAPAEEVEESSATPAMEKKAPAKKKSFWDKFKW